jgi:uncharacterized Zn finger protein
MNKKYSQMLMLASLFAGGNLFPKLKVIKEKQPLYIWQCKICGKTRKSRLQEFSGLPCEKCNNDDETQFEIIEIKGETKNNEAREKVKEEK